ncbi:MAG: thiol:disulfide interchange protein DsbD [Candidatus Azotimanducaceae bacterium]|jgi:thiol:disulfide interchange protein DsbD
MLTVIDKLGYRPSVIRSRLAEVSKSSVTEHVIPEPVAASITRAKKANSYIFVDFYAEWCGACKVMEMTTLVDPQVLNTLDRFQVLKIDADEYPRATQYYNIVGMPTYLILDSRGKEVYRQVGPIESSMLIEDLSFFIKN